jgi:hypothetical protein
MKTYIEEFLMTFSGFHQTVFSFLTDYSLQQLFPQLTAHSNFFHSHSPTKQTLSPKDRVGALLNDVWFWCSIDRSIREGPAPARLEFSRATQTSPSGSEGL